MGSWRESGYRPGLPGPPVMVLYMASRLPPETVRAIEDAILARARQLRIADGKI